MSSSTAGDRELQRTERGFIIQIEPFYLVVEFPGGIQANLLRSQWPEGAREPAIGLTIQCRYLPMRHEVIEVVQIGLRSLRRSGTRPQPRSDQRTDAPQANDERTEAGGKTSAREPLDPAFFARQHDAGRNYEMMMFLRDRAAGGYIEWYTERAATEARYRDPVPPLSPLITRAIQGSAEGLSDFRLYLHQARALEALRAGRDLLLVTPTASGKTLCYNPAIFESFHQRDPSARALYIFPLNALLIDHLEKIHGLREALKHDQVTINADLWIGGLSSHQRDRIAARNPHILGTNPEMLGLLLGRAPTNGAVSSNGSALLSSTRCISIVGCSACIWPGCSAGLRCSAPGSACSPS
ncbi:MAG: DEAD/DEAH box helicase [Oscillochloris sp.]|nr:DEAD/DEAH box helicase [Oscillochloris sp.]